MSEQRQFRAQIGPYWLLLPKQARISANVEGPPEVGYLSATTRWEVLLDRFRLFIHLDPIHELEGLKKFIDSCTKGNVTTRSIVVNDVPGVTFGDYAPPVTWIDWWFKKGDTMICLNLQALSDRTTQPSPTEIEEHKAIIGSLKFCRDYPSELPPQMR